jgi:hypothetical protein
MEIHKPKPVRSWRELFSEIGIIVLGVSIALAAEQAVETLHNRDRAATARANIRAEIATELGRMNAREATEACVARRLDEVDGLIAASAAGKLPPDALWIGQPVAYIMIDGKYRAAVQSGAVSLFGDQEQAAYAGLYAVFVTYWEQVQEEAKAWGDLRTLEKHPAPSPVLDWQLRSAMQRARIARYSVDLSRENALRTATVIGVTPARARSIPMPSPCIPLHTAREKALKLRSHNFDAPVP